VEPVRRRTALSLLQTARTPLLGALVGALAMHMLPNTRAVAAAVSSTAATAKTATTWSHLPGLLLNVAALLVALRLAFLLRRYVRSHVSRAVAKFKAQWKGALFIPVVAAIVGWLTNWIAVQMIFYPINFLGLPVKQAVLGSIYGCDVLSPLGWGWQGIVPAKAAQMALNMVTMVTDKLIDVQEVFRRLQPDDVARILVPELPHLALQIGPEAGVAPWAVAFAEARLRAGVLPQEILSTVAQLQHDFVAGFTKALQDQVHRVLDLKELVVTSMVADKRLIVAMFQRCGEQELRFLVDSGLWFGFLLGLIQMVVWLFYDSPWTLTAGGAIVGFATNWLALKCIFEPVEPTKFGPFVLQGLFLRRQREVSAEFADFFVDRVLTSRRMWNTMLAGLKAPDFRALLREYTCKWFAPQEISHLAGDAPLAGAIADDVATSGMLLSACEQACDRVADLLPPRLEQLHPYVDATLELRTTIKAKLELMTPAEFERVLHPIFEEDELTLIIAGAVLGAIAGYIQQITTVSEPPPAPAAQETKP